MRNIKKGEEMVEAKLVSMKQYPMRMDAILFNRLSEVSSATGIPKSTILRMGATKLLDELESSGVTNAMGSIRKTQ